MPFSPSTNSSGVLLSMRASVTFQVSAFDGEAAVEENASAVTSWPANV